MPIVLVPALLGLLTIALVTSVLSLAVMVGRLRRDRGAWRVEKERLADEIWELRAAAAARDKAEAASEAKSRFLATVSHEFRTPLNGIIGMADLLQGTALSGEQRSYVEAVRSSGQALAEMIDEVLDFSRIEAGRIDLAAEEVDLTVLVEGVVELLAPRAHDKGLDIAALIATGCPARVLGDAARLRQVLLNLAGNAVKFTERGGVGLRVETIGSKIRFSVSDTGPGVPEDRRAAIFTEFEQADNSTTRRHGGTGLGLAISHRLVTRMGGDLCYQPRGEGGSIFIVSVALPPLEVDDASPSSLPPRGDARSALVVSAAPFTAAFVAESLKGFGIVTETADCGASAMRRLAQDGFAPDLLLCDPGSIADTLRPVIAAAQHRGVATIITMVTPRDRHAGRVEAGREGWLVKPVRRRSLLERLHPASMTGPSGPAIGRDDGSAERRRHVLLAEDNPINALIVRRAFERLGVEVTHVADGLSAFDRLRSNLSGDEPRYDLVLMDVSMPGLDGLEVTRRIRRLEHGQAGPPLRIVALTAHAMEDSQRACRRAGMDDVIIKPISPTSLTELLDGPEAFRAAG